MTVAADGSGNFKSVQEAVDSIPLNTGRRFDIYIKNGIYKEKVIINKPDIRLVGENREKTIITFDDYAYKLFPDGKKYQTFNSYTFFAGADGFFAENITFENSSGDGSKVGQAIAVYADADRICFKNCAFLGYQDTLFTGPLPPKPVIPGSFAGPRENSERRDTRQYYENCYIKGTIDFIFGSATAVFNNCELFSVNLKNEPSFITAPSTPHGKEFGYVFIDCFLKSDSDMPTVFLGRPWREFARSVYINCWMGSHINPEGWDNWNKQYCEKTILFAEYNSSGPGAETYNRVKWAKTLEYDEVKKYSIENILKFDYKANF